jgi:NADH:ubiquinone oxidoreductase subunit F (NADH-binding)/NAD-dependent dihydropyrimidine dehydrogenase PreA subunit
MKPEEIIKIVADSDLRGRGGAGFPTATKWSILSQSKSETGDKYLVCNADQGDPGAFMDRCILEGDPLSVIEGMTIAAYATEATHGFVYVRAEYPFAVKRLILALELAREHHYLGKNIMGTNFSFDIEIKKGAGAFVCGEETAMMRSIEGKRGMPTPRPPYPAQKGIWDKPTNINNVKTYASTPIILRNGAEWFKKSGKTLGGTAVLALSGKVNNNGLIEVPIGTSIREIIFDIGGGIANGKRFKAVQTGGPSGGCIDETCLDLPLDYQSLNKAGAIMGSGGLIVMDEDDSMISVAKFFLKFTQDESCGKCTPCREGTKRMLEILTKISDGKGTQEDLDKLQKLADTIKNTALCGLGQTAPNPVLSTIRYFRNEYDAKINEKKKEKPILYAITDRCKGCDKCTNICPTHAIDGKIREIHVINRDKCVGCGACSRECSFKAIFKEDEIPEGYKITTEVFPIVIQKK